MQSTNSEYVSPYLAICHFTFRRDAANNKYNFLLIRLCFINVYTYPYNNAKSVITVVKSENVRYIDVPSKWSCKYPFYP